MSRGAALRMLIALLVTGLVFGCGARTPTPMIPEADSGETDDAPADSRTPDDAHDACASQRCDGSAPATCFEIYPMRCGTTVCNASSVCFHGCPASADAGTIACGSAICAASEICTRSTGGVDASPTVFDCVPGPEQACGSDLNCCYDVCGALGLENFNPISRVAICHGS